MSAVTTAIRILWVVKILDPGGGEMGMQNGKKFHLFCLFITEFDILIVFIARFEGAYNTKNSV